MDSKKELDIFEIMNYMDINPKKVYQFLSKLNKESTEKPAVETKKMETTISPEAN
ncbi:hypothetical protein [Paenibacillus mesophilus]|uniref:hypothetical protein n=1 Tax=Paenibacillus mesophilus TaxID=2582849 RepID=UPI0013050BE6|nr:hypothetical protein [Paenibacillus mesophilus]